MRTLPLELDSLNLDAAVKELLSEENIPEYPDSHRAGMKVPKGGSSCESCKYLADNKKDCTSEYFQKWNGSEVIPGPIDSYCSDWYVPASDLQANYKLEGRTEFRGLKISIENDKGSVREGIDKSGKPWKVTMSVPYGYVRMSQGVDGDHFDAFIGPNEDAENVYVINTKEPTTDEFDEQKAMVGFDSAEEAKKVFLENYSDPRFFGSMETIPFEKFKEKVLQTKDNPERISAYGTVEGLDIESAVEDLLSSGTSEGAVRGWDTRGRGRKEAERDKQIWQVPLYRGTTTRRLEDVLKEGMTPAKSSFNISSPGLGPATPEHGAIYATYQRPIAEHYAMLKKAYNEATPGHAFRSEGMVFQKPSNGPQPIKGTKPVIVKMEVSIGLMKKFKSDPESPDSYDSYLYRGTIPKEYISGVEVYDKGKWSNYDWKQKVAAAGDEETSTLYFILDDIKDLQKHDIKAESLFHGMKIIGFTGGEAEFVRATASRVPPELMTHVKRIIAAPWLGVIHGKYIPETGTIFLNPKNTRARARLGEGQGWVNHGELTTVHEIMHSVYDNLPEDVKDKWMELSGWMVGTQPGQDTPYEEKRPGWEPGTSKWTHRKNIKFPRIYSEKSPDENFADCASFYLLNKAHQIDSKQKEFIEQLFEKMVKNYPKYNVESPDKPYGEKHVAWALKSSGTSEGAEKGWDTRGRGKKEPIDYRTNTGVHVGIFDRPESGQEPGTIPIETVFNHPPPSEEERKKIADEFNGAVKVGEKELDINQIIPMQKTLTEQRLTRWRSREERGLNPRSPAAVFHRGDSYFLMDGHHRIGDEIMKGTKKLKMTEFALPQHVSAEALDIAAAIQELLAANKSWWNSELMMGSEDIEAYGTSDGVRKAWDTRSRGQNKADTWEDKVKRVASTDRIRSGSGFIFTDGSSVAGETHNRIVVKAGLPVDDTAFRKATGAVRVVNLPGEISFQADQRPTDRQFDEMEKLSDGKLWVLWHIGNESGKGSISQLRLRLGMQAYGTPEGVTKSWDARGRGEKPKYQTGIPVTIDYFHRELKAPKMGSRFGQDVEPKGRYLNERPRDYEPSDKTWTVGTVTFKNPLVLDWGGGYGEPDNWKNALSRQYGGATGVRLSKAIIGDGHDGIITMDKYGSSEIVDLTNFKVKAYGASEEVTQE